MEDPPEFLLSSTFIVFTTSEKAEIPIAKGTMKLIKEYFKKNLRKNPLFCLVQNLSSKRQDILFKKELPYLGSIKIFLNIKEIN